MGEEAGAIRNIGLDAGGGIVDLKPRVELTRLGKPAEVRADPPGGRRSAKRPAV